jgi:hypothetical protein
MVLAYQNLVESRGLPVACADIPAFRSEPGAVRHGNLGVVAISRELNRLNIRPRKAKR